MKVDQSTRETHEEVTLLKRGLIAAFVLALMLALAASVLAFDGARNDFVGSEAYASPGSGLTCHAAGGVADVICPVPQDPQHAQADNYADETANALPAGEGPGCGGSHSSDYDPTKACDITVTPSARWSCSARSPACGRRSP